MVALDLGSLFRDTHCPEDLFPVSEAIVLSAASPTFSTKGDGSLGGLGRSLEVTPSHFLSCFLSRRSYYDLVPSLYHCWHFGLHCYYHYSPLEGEIYSQEALISTISTSFARPRSIILNSSDPFAICSTTAVHSS